MSSNNNLNRVYIRSGFLGDILVCLPYIIYDITINNIPLSNVCFLIIQKTNNIDELKNKKLFNPIEAIFGINHIFTKNSIVVSNYSLAQLYNAGQVFKRKFNEANFYYLPFRKENNIHKIKKALFFFLVFIRIKNTNFLFSRKKRIFNEYAHFFDDVISFKEAIQLLKKSADFFHEVFLDQFNSINSPYVLVYPNSQLNIKKWPIESFSNIVQDIFNKTNYQILLVGAKGDFDYNEDLKEQLPNYYSSRVINIAGKFAVDQFIELSKKAVFFIGNDGGPMHMAALGGTPVLALFSYKEEDGLWDPLIAQQYVTFHADVACKVCNKLICQNNLCLKNINTDTVKFVLNNFYSQKTNMDTSLRININKNFGFDFFLDK